jgi:hypothetical protein
MSRVQSFTSMAVWPKSKPSTVRYLRVSRRRKGAKGQWLIKADNQESASGGPSVLGLVDKTVCTRQPLVLLVWDLETECPDELHG